MSNGKRYVVADNQTFTYAADAVSLRAVRDAGGVSKLSAEALRKIKFKTVNHGEDCSDLPEPAFSIYLERGWIVEAKAADEGGGE